MKRELKSFLAGLVFAACLFAIPSAGQAQEGSYYTRFNIWYEKPEKIMSTNYHKGAILPAGTEVEIDKSGKKIKFHDKAAGTKYRIVLVKDFTNLSETEFFDRYFSKESVLKSNEYESFSAMEKENIKNGTIEEGMSKAAVIMAYGYPPTHMTPSTNDKTWTYWKSRFVNYTIQFEGDTLKSIMD